MEMTFVTARDILAPEADRPRYSICTMMTRPEEYREMRASFAGKGFTTGDCEYLYADNSQQNRLDAFAAYNRFLVEASGDYIVLCHQDILLLDDDRARLDMLLAQLTEHDPDWALCGNAGAKTDGTLALRITDPNTPDCSAGGPFPAKVASLDENFIVVRREANLALSHDVAGFHWYGADLCIVADILGYGAYVIDFHLRHKSGGNPDRDFGILRQHLTLKYRRAFRPRWCHVVTKNPAYLSASGMGHAWARIKRRLLS